MNRSNTGLFFRTGIVHFMAFPEILRGEGPIEQTFEQLVRDPYFEVIETGWIKDRGTRARVRQLAASGRVEVVSAAQPRLLTQRLDLNHPEPAERSRAIDEMKRCVDDALEIGASSLAFLSGSFRGPEDCDAAKERLTDSIRQVARHAPDSLQLVLEIFDRDIDKCCLLGPASECAEFAAALRLDVPRFGLLADLSHLPLLNENPAQGLRPIASNLVHVHVGNAFLGDRADPAWGDQHPRFGYQGGRNDVDELSEFLRELFAIGYLKSDGRGRRPVISFEVKPTAGEDAWAVIAGSKRTLALAWQQLNLP